MGHRIISTAHHDVKMQQQDFGDKIASVDYECPWPGAGAYVPACAARKRKLEEEEVREPKDCEDEDEEDTGSYLEHRQSVFNISMGKLNSYKQIPDPSLRRSVLICNTLRTIEGEMVSEGMEVDAAASSAFLPSIQTDSITNLDLDPPPPPVLDYPEPPDHERRLTDLDWSSGRATPHPEPPRPMSEWDGQQDLPYGCSQQQRPFEPSPERDKGGSRAISWSSVLNFSSQSDLDAANGNGGDLWSCEGPSSSGGPNTSPSASSDSGISTASDEIFGDIDLSLYDFDLLPLSPPIAARQAPPSAEELLRAFSNQPAPP